MDKNSVYQIFCIVEVTGKFQGKAAKYEDIFEKYAGKYSPGITVTIEQGQLYFLGASGVKRRLFALEDDSFLIEDSSVPPENQARIRFVRNAEGAITELRLMVSDGRSFPRVREKD